MDHHMKHYRYDFRMCVLLIITVLAVFGQMCGHEFVSADDNVYVTKNRYVQSGLNAKSIVWAFTSTHAEYFEQTFPAFLKGYEDYLAQAGSSKKFNKIMKRLEKIETRGRYVEKRKRK